MSEIHSEPRPSLLYRFVLAARGDRMLWTAVIVLTLFSLLAVYSSAGSMAFSKHNGNFEYELFKHALLAVAGLVAMFFAHRINYRYYARIAEPLLIGSIVLLLITLMVGGSTNNAARWLKIPGTGLTFQTSEFAKVALMIYLAKALSQVQDKVGDFKSLLMPVVLPVVIVCALIGKENLSTAILLFATSTLIMFVGRISLGHIARLYGLGALIFVLFLGIASLTGYKGRIQTWQNRIEAYLHPSDEPSATDLQTTTAKIAVVSGGITGLGPGNSIQRNYLPHPYADYIFAVIVEEYGLIGASLVLLAYMVILFRCVVIVFRSPRAFGSMLAMGLGLSLTLQALVHMAVSTTLFPVTGQTLPLVSVGGTSMIFIAVAFGIILSVARDAEENGGELKASPNSGSGARPSNRLRNLPKSGQSNPLSAPKLA